MPQPNAPARGANPAGVYPMLFAFFDREGELDEAAIRLQVRAQLAAGAHGIAVLGLASEGNKLSTAERLGFVEWVSDELAGRVPLSVTVCEASVAGQIVFARQAIALGASWLILQPPPVKGMTERALADFFSRVAEGVDAPIALQLAPDYLSGSLTAGSARALARRRPNIAILKVEMNALDVWHLIEETEGAFSVFNGHAGLDMPDSLAAGCVGFIPGAESTDRLVAIFDGLKSGKPGEVAAAERHYKDLAPLLSFLITGMDNFLVYGKALMARRLGLSPASGAVRPPTSGHGEFGLAILNRWSRDMPPFPGALS